MSVSYFIESVSSTEDLGTNSGLSAELPFEIEKLSFLLQHQIWVNKWIKEIKQINHVKCLRRNVHPLEQEEG